MAKVRVTVDDLKEYSQKIDSALSGDESSLEGQILNIYEKIKDAEKNKELAGTTDLRENSGYHTAIENIARLQIEMRNLENKKLAFEKFTGDYEPTEYIGIGTTVYIESVKANYIIKLVPPDLGNASIRAVSIDSPVGKGLMGKRKGDVIVVKTHADTYDYTIKQIY